MCSTSAAWSPAFPAAVLLRGSRAAWQWSPLVLDVEGRLAPAQLAKDRRRHRARVDHRIEVLGPHLQSLLLVRVRDRVRVRGRAWARIWVRVGRLGLVG